ncbi:MAG TPA: TCP-1/cpn60 chaperonin family protein [Methylomusa anaerophila]|uniref:60 kDa chaperonin 1 n=1 Tax=Methylomusa anaerophila TaxID=1930071 RepID=A0A348ANX6_9FIRM|nr:TCP-1/cpn60 chaperonin family protein [Methylomusa anaerophila]BBB92774.1 60 kDa chaperonin 1 [Methylomusa anaerophila]HML87375.1 TCP-1/cpn60 chaperonin family protein [Methylomusa anaerophila]
MNLKQAGSGADVDERLAALMTNANAVRAITAAVEGTIGPKGLDTMLVDRFGEVIITNDGVTILDKMDVNHPAAKMLINIAKAQQAEVGDGTTTATIMAGTLVAEGVSQVIRGVPVARVIEGVKYGVAHVIKAIKERGRQVNDIDDPILRRIAMIAGREHEDIADLVVEAARLIGVGKLSENTFKLSEIITAEAGADNEVFMGVIVNQERMTQEMPERIEKAKILLIDDALEPEEIEDEALSTEAGFKRYIELQDEFKNNIHKIVQLGVNVVMVDRGVHEAAEEILTDAGVQVVQRVSAKDLRRVADHAGARMIKRTGLKKNAADIEKYLGYAEKVYEDEKLEHMRVLGGRGKPMATILVGAATEEVVGERERIAKDAASSVQAAVKGGYVPGGGSMEISMAREVIKFRENLKGMSAYGIDCVVNALKQPLSQIVENAGYNPLEKVEEVINAQVAAETDSLGVDCDSGEVADMLERGVVDPVPVKLHAIKAAGEVAVAILRIDTIIKKKEENTAAQKSGGSIENEMPDF